MERFSGAIRSAYEEHECPPDIHEALGRLIERKVPEIDGYLLSPVSSLPSKVADVLQLGTRRTIDLTESSIREINREQVISSCLLVRGVLETACLRLSYLGVLFEPALPSNENKLLSLCLFHHCHS